MKTKQKGLEVMNIDIMQTGTVLAIVVIAYLVGLGIKCIPKIPDKIIPVVVGFVGAILGVVGMYVIPDFPANDVLNAIAVGIVSGLASTGVHQAIKQLEKKSE
jgi:Na+/H+-dicarboxylate symporter